MGIRIDAFISEIGIDTADTCIGSMQLISGENCRPPNYSRVRSSFFPLFQLDRGIERPSRRFEIDTTSVEFYEQERTKEFFDKNFLLSGIATASSTRGVRSKLVPTVIYPTRFVAVAGE